MTEKKSFSITGTIELYCHILKSMPSRNEALKVIAEQATEDFGDFITPGSLNLKNEIEINFAELLDQIIYEFRENTDFEANIRDYIIDDLYSRLYMYLESFNSLDQYIKNIKNRTLFQDDCIIIKNKKIYKLIPLLIEEYEELTILQKPLIKALIHLAEETPSEFFLKSFNDSSQGFIKSAALLGLKYREALKPEFFITAEISRNCTLPFYAEKFNPSAIWKNAEPSNKEEITFVLLHIEKNIKNFNDVQSTNWILDTINLIPQMNFENSWLNEINTSVCNILLNIEIDLIKEFLNNDEKLLTAINFIDLFPKNIFNRLTGRLDELGLEFHYRLNSVLEKNKFMSDDLNSNMFNYLSWNTM
jgi:hypothetical protein